MRAMVRPLGCAVGGLMQFDLFRMALSERAQLDLFDPATRPTREAWLRDVLSREIIFMHRKEQFHYAPDPHAPPEGQDIVGRIGRKRAAVENEPPARGLVETKRDKWTAARLLIDPSHHADGQKIAMENVQSVGKPFGLL